MPDPEDIAKEMDGPAAWRKIDIVTWINDTQDLNLGDIYSYAKQATEPNAHVDFLDSSDFEKLFAELADIKMDEGDMELYSKLPISSRHYLRAALEDWGTEPVVVFYKYEGPEVVIKDVVRAFVIDQGQREAEARS